MKPFSLRVGGTNTDGAQLDFLPHDSSTCKYKYQVTESVVKSLFEGMKSLRGGVIWGLNAMSCRNGTFLDHPYEFTETKAFAQWLVQNGYWNDTLDALEFGNEPNLFLFNWYRMVSARQLASDYQTLYRLLQDMTKKDDSLSSPKLVGPDVAVQVPILKEVIPYYMQHFMDHIVEEKVPLHAVSWHFYPLVSFNCPVGYELDKSTPENLVKASTMNSFRDKQQSFFGSIDSDKYKRYKEYIPSIIFGEGAASACSGQNKVDDYFVSSFAFLNSVSALAKIPQGDNTYYFRQSISGSAATVDHTPYLLLVHDAAQDEWVARPDFFAAYLWKKLMKEIVLDVQGEYTYAHCNSATLSVLVLNPTPQSRSVSLSMEGVSFSSQEVYIYNMEPSESWNNSPQVKCNGQVLQLEQSEMPSIAPVKKTVGDTFVLNAYSYAFFSFSGPDLASCKAAL